jgi:hypothetical protein
MVARLLLSVAMTLAKSRLEGSNRAEDSMGLPVRFARDGGQWREI